MIFAAMTASTALVLARKKNESDERICWRQILSTPLPSLYLDPKAAATLPTFPRRAYIYQWIPSGTLAQQLYQPDTGDDYLNHSHDTVSLSDASSLSIHSDNSGATQVSSQKDDEMKYYIYISTISSKELVPDDVTSMEWIYIRLIREGDDLKDNEISYISSNVFFDGKKFSFNKYTKLLNQQVKRFKCQSRKKQFCTGPLVLGQYRIDVHLKLGAICGFMYWYDKREPEEFVDVDYVTEESSHNDDTSSTDRMEPSQKSTLNSMKSYDTSLLVPSEAGMNDLALAKNKSPTMSPQTAMLRGTWTRLKELTGGGVSKIPINDEKQKPKVIPLLRAENTDSQIYEILHALSGQVYLGYLGETKKDILYPIIWSLKIPNGSMEDVSIHDCLLTMGVGRSTYMMVPVNSNDLIWASPHHTVIPESSYKDNVSPLKEVQLRTGSRMWRNMTIVERDLIVDGEIQWVRVSIRVPKGVKASVLSIIILVVESSMMKKPVLVSFIKLTTWPLPNCDDVSTPVAATRHTIKNRMTDTLPTSILDIVNYAKETTKIIQPWQIKECQEYKAFQGDVNILFTADYIQSFEKNRDKLRAGGSNSTVHAPGKIHRIQLVSIEVDNSDIDILTGATGVLRMRIFMWKSTDDNSDLQMNQYDLASAHYKSEVEPMVTKSTYYGLFKKLEASRTKLKIDMSFAPKLHRGFYSRKNKNSNSTNSSTDLYIPLTMVDRAEEQDILLNSNNKDIPCRIAKC